jgi:small subunit ribosomal protein S4
VLAQKKRGLTGLNFLQTLETRFDNVVFRIGFAVNRAQARELVSHGHFMVNEVRTDIPSMLLKPGDKIAVREGSQSATYFKELKDVAETRNTPTWLERDLKNLSGRVLRLPDRAEIDGNITEQLIVEYYSR